MNMYLSRTGSMIQLTEN